MYTFHHILENISTKIILGKDLSLRYNEKEEKSFFFFISYLLFKLTCI